MFGMQCPPSARFGNPDKRPGRFACVRAFRKKGVLRKGYYVNTVGRIREAIERYLCNQLQEDFNKDQMGMKEYIDLFTCEPGAGCQKSPLRGKLVKDLRLADLSLSL